MTSNKVLKEVEEYKILSLAESARTKGMWAGALEKTAMPGLCGLYVKDDGGYEIRPIARDHTPALMKIIDEGLVNASDHFKEHEKERRPSDRVRNISLRLDRVTGKIAIENDGPGFPVVKHEAASKARGRTVYVPEVAMAFFLAGRNMKKPPDSVKGGINGIGAKLILVHSTYFKLQTVGLNAEGKLTGYTQEFRNRLRVIVPPVITETLPKSGRKPHTRIEFVPAYKELGYAAGAGSPLTKQDADDLEAWCRWRMFVLAAYTGPKASVRINGNVCPTTSAKALAELYVTDEDAIIMTCTAKATKMPFKAHPWDLAIALVPSQKRFAHVSVVNGVHCSKGSHITYLKKMIGDAVSAKAARVTKAKKKMSLAESCKQVFLVAVGALPGSDWGGQRKDELQVGRDKLSPYTIAPTSLGKIATTIVDLVLQNLEKPTRARKKLADANKFVRARRAGTKDRDKCFLIAAEGDSAMGLFRAGLTLGPKKNPGGPSFEYYGIMSLGGVVINAMRHVKEITNRSGGATHVRTEKLKNNVVLAKIVDKCGLDFTCKYDRAEDRKKLPYAGLIIGTDQDHDGFKIKGLLASFIHLFWPNLIIHGWLKTFVTPVIRAYPKKGGKPAEFYQPVAFERWAGENGGMAAVVRTHTVNYYKGLGGHDDAEAKIMFQNFEKLVYTYTLDDSSADLFEIYFGKDPALRKIELASPVNYLSYEEALEIHRTRLLSWSTQLRTDVKACKLDIIQRQIPGIDGLTVARRKVLAASLRRFSHNNRAVRVFQLGGYVAEHMFYHHGDASLNKTITGMAQRFPCALNFPYLIGKGQFGTRHEGGDDASSARYISVCLASPYAKAMFPAEDSWLLGRVFEDGEPAQPKFYLPVLATPLIESFEIPSEGWRHKSYARDLDQVVKMQLAYAGAGAPADVRMMAMIARAMESAPPNTKLPALVDSGAITSGTLARFRLRFPLDVSLRGYGKGLSPAERKDLVRRYNGRLYSFGMYHVEHTPRGAVVWVTELPLRRTTQKFLQKLEKPPRVEFIEAAESFSGKKKINIRIQLKPGAWEAILEQYGSSQVDPIEDFLLLRSSLQSFLNYSSEDGVIEFGEDYHSLFFYYAPQRKDLYRARFLREATVLRLKILLEKELVRYILGAERMQLNHKASETEAAKTLAAFDFPMLDAGLIQSPQFTPVGKIEELATAGPNISYDYIFNLRERDLVASARKKREEKIEKLTARLGEVQKILGEKPFAGASVWIQEIQAALAAIRSGEKSKWRWKF
jgi:DNA topoisomerase II